MAEVEKCFVQVKSFEWESKTTVTTNEPTNVGRKVNVTPDCKDEYESLKSMKPGLKTRKLESELAALGCISYQPIYITKQKRPQRATGFSRKSQKKR
jgi:hypothetical protein